MSSNEQNQPVGAGPQNQERTRRMRGLRVVVATLLVIGLVAAITTEMRFGQAAPPSSEGAAPALPPSMEWGISPGPAGPAGPDEFQDRVPTPPSTIVG